ncbi:MAG: Ig-like domain-containing protein [Gaiellales bacterium]
MRRLLAAGAVLATLSLTLAAAPAPAATVGIWLTPGEIAALPMSGPAWDRVKATADGNLGLPDLGDYNSDHDVRTLAVALVYVRTGEALYRLKAADAIMGAIGTEDGGQAVTLGRNLDSYVFAADLIDLASFDAARDAQFRTWLAGVRHEVFSDGSLISNDENRANNHGRVAGGSRVAVAAYLGDAVDLARAAQVFKGWLGDRSSYASFKYGDLSWQADPALPVGINPPGAVKDGHAIGGAMPEEMRRGCSFRWPPCPTGYPWGGLQGALIEAEVLFRSGYDAFAWESQALRRAAQFILDLDQALGGWWATGDDTWQPWFVNFAYGTAFPTRDAAIGKTMGWTDWTHARVRGGGGNTPPSCSDVSLTVAEGTAGEVAPACVDLDLDPLGFGIVGQGSKGVASVVAGQLRYEPAAGETGADSFSYRANDGSADGNVAIVSVTITPAGGGGPVTLLPNGDGTRSAVIRDKNGGTTSLFSSIDDTIATPDNGTTYVRNNNRASGSYFARLTDVPAGFAGMAALTVDVRARTTGRVDDLTTLYAQVFAADEATPLTAEVAVITNPGTSGFVTVSGVVLTGVVAGSEADWDGATLRLRWQHAAVGSADTTQLRLTAVELHGMSF